MDSGREADGPILLHELRGTAPGFPEAPFLERMGAMARLSRFSQEVRERAVRMVWEHQAQHASQGIA